MPRSAESSLRTGEGLQRVPGCGVRLLLVDDEPALARALARGLAAEGFAVDVRTDGPSGLQQAVDEDYDVVLLAGRLPGMSGYDVVRA
ncbi:MAG: DNA-binding response regulator, partial [Frankiales bacterium]|nr:DNA-binding response regulator [Frankiales bacterium]